MANSDAKRTAVLDTIQSILQELPAPTSNREIVARLRAIAEPMTMSDAAIDKMHAEMQRRGLMGGD